MNIPRRSDIINAALAGRVESTYLEIGVRSGRTLRRIAADLRIGVDPRFIDPELRTMARSSETRMAQGDTAGVLPLQMTSDEFFTRHAAFLSRRHLDVAFVDGLHTADQAYRDVLNSLRFMTATGLVIAHDCSPRSPAEAEPSMEAARQHPGFTGTWCGGVFRAIVRLRAQHPNLRVCVLDMDFGLGLIRWGRPESTLDLDDREIDGLTYDALAADRSRLLNLRPPGHVSEFLEGALALGGAR